MTKSHILRHMNTLPVYDDLQNLFRITHLMISGGT